MLAQVGLDQRRADSYPHQLSGGEKQKALICIALANDPDVLILDEPTAALDALTKLEIVTLLKEAAHDRITLVITHDIDAAAKLSESCCDVCRQDPLSWVQQELLENPMHPYTRAFALLSQYDHNQLTVQDSRQNVS